MVRAVKFQHINLDENPILFQNFDAKKSFVTEQPNIILFNSDSKKRQLMEILCSNLECSS